MRFLIWTFTLLLAGCSTVSQQEVFDSLQKESGQNILWIQNSHEAKEVYQTVEKMLSKPLNEENALKIALINNRTLQQAYAEVGVSYGELVDAGLLSNPVLGYSLGHGSGITTRTLSLEWAFLDLLWLPLRKEMAGLALEETKYRVEETIHKTLKDVQIAYVEAVVSEKKMALIEEMLISHEATYQLALRQKTAGNLSMRDLQKIRDSYARMRLEMYQARHAAYAARENLNRFLGIFGKATEYILDVQEIAVPATLDEMENAEENALENRSEMSAAHQKVLLRAKEAGFAENSRYLGELTIGAEREKTTGEEMFKTYSIALPLPLFNRGEGTITRSESLYNQSVHELYETAVRIRSEVRETLSNRYYIHAMAREYEESILPANQKILEETGLYYNGMLDGIYELLEDQRRFSEARIEALDVRAEYRKSEIELSYVTGIKTGTDKGVHAK